MIVELQKWISNNQSKLSKYIVESCLFSEDPIYGSYYIDLETNTHLARFTLWNNGTCHIESASNPSGKLQFSEIYDDLTEIEMLSIFFNFLKRIGVTL